MYAQGRIIAQYITDMPARAVCELATGKAATIRELSYQFPGTAFTGLDLPHGQLDVHAKKPGNLTLVEGDYHDLSQFADASFDLVYIIEALCHAHSKSTVIKEANRILRPGGLLIIFDGYSAKSSEAMTDDEHLAMRLTFASMMVQTEDHAYDRLQKTLRDEHFTIVKENNLSERVLPSMQRLEKKAATLFRHPRLARLATTLVGATVTGNAIAAYLMPVSVKSGLFQYWLTVAKKI